MSNNFEFLDWIRDNRVGPYSKDSSGKKMLNESVEEAMDLTPPSPENIYEPEESQSEQDFYDRAWGLAGTQIKQVIDDLRGDGFEDDEIMDIFRTSVEMYDQAFSGMSEESSLQE